MNIYSALSNLVLLIHFAFVTFIAVGLIVVWVGYFCHWSFVRNLRFRLAHLLAMGFVLLESVAGMICPLTTWEVRLRLRAGQDQTYEGSFMEHWIGRVLFYDLDERVFIITYAVTFAAIALTLWFVPPRRPTRA